MEIIEPLREDAIMQEKQNVTREDYRKMIDEFCRENPNYRMKLDRETVRNGNLFAMPEKDELIEFVNQKLCRKAKSLKYLQDQRNALKKFYKWSMERGYVDWEVNPLETEQYAYDVFAEAFIEDMNITVFDEERLFGLLKRFEINQELYRFLVASFYSGFSRIKDLVQLRERDIDRQQSAVKINGVMRAMPKLFFDVLDAYQKCGYYEHFTVRKDYAAEHMVPIRNKRAVYKDFIIKVQEDSGLTDELYMKRTQVNIAGFFENISEVYGREITADMLYISGFIQYVKKKCEKEGKNVSYLIRLFKPGERELAFWRIKDYADEYGFPYSSSTNIRLICYPYIVKSSFYC